jgi:beta-lactamase regulating signal transducer with metallopeptidase domain
LTYGMHALVWSVAATLLVRRKPLSSSFRHSVWKVALFAPFLTTLLADSIPWLRERAIPIAPWVEEIEVISFVHHPSLERRIVQSPLDEARQGPTLASDLPTHWESWPRLVLLCLLACVAIGLCRYAAAALMLARDIRDRAAGRDYRLLEHLERLRERLALGPVEITTSERINSPLVLGRSEICFPARLLSILTDAELDAVLAHELAHLERSDGLWFPLAGLVQSVLWAQPLNHWVASRFRQTAELASDDRAVELTGQPMDLARALMRVAASAVASSGSSLVPALAQSESITLKRIKRLVTLASPPTPGPACRHRWVLLSLGLTGLATIGLGLREARSEPRSYRAAPAVVNSTKSSEPASPADATMASLAIAELLSEQRRAGIELEKAMEAEGANEPNSSATARVLELQQQLNHARAQAAWMEQQFIANSSGEPPAPR